MKRLIPFIATVALSAVVLGGCAASQSAGGEAPGEAEPFVGMANPWRESTEEEAYKYAPNGFSAPEGATNVSWSLMLPDNDPAKEDYMLVQLTFEQDGLEYTAREQAAAEDEADISGMYYDWQNTESVTLDNWGGGNMSATIKSCSEPEESACICLWYDTETGYAYSLGTAGSDLDLSKVDIKKTAEAIYDPAKQIGGNAPEIPESAPEEATDEFLSSIAEEAPQIDISGCATFTGIVDKKLSDGMGYANEKIGDTDVLLVSSGTYDNLDGNNAAIDATIFMYKDEAPFEVGKVCCGGTAYPLAIRDGELYVGSNHWICKYTIENDSLKITQKAAVDYDKNGNEIYYYESVHGDANNYDTVKTELMFETLYDELFEAKVIDFQPVGGASGSESALPAYEYPGPEAFYSVLYKYLIDEFGPDYEKDDVTIPCPVIIEMDESDKDDIKVWGDFWVFNYDLNGDVLENTSGGSYPGLIHIKSTDDSNGYEVTDIELVGDGSEYEPTAKKIFGKYYDEFINSSSDGEKRDALRAQIIANYAAANNLKITAFKDYGWDPVSLPGENIDSFYSILN
ncbi:MAG: hypothetical protein K5985_08745 [Lachnospiraceae bacterium]|nr:hypothetical protein [Lachnospiraceae bacterium]